MKATYLVTLYKSTNTRGQLETESKSVICGASTLDGARAKMVELAKNKLRELENGTLYKFDIEESSSSIKIVCLSAGVKAKSYEFIACTQWA